MSKRDAEENRLSARVARYAKVGVNVGGVAAKVAGQRLMGSDGSSDKNAQDLKAALGGLKGPIMKVAQMMATIPEALPKEYAAELSQLQSMAPAMGWPFVKRRMAAELGPGWTKNFAAFEREAAAAASLGQVHKAETLEGDANQRGTVDQHAAHNSNICPLFFSQTTTRRKRLRVAPLHSGSQQAASEFCKFIQCSRSRLS